MYTEWTDERIDDFQRWIRKEGERLGIDAAAFVSVYPTFAAAYEVYVKAADSNHVVNNV